MKVMFGLVTHPNSKYYEENFHFNISHFMANTENEIITAISRENRSESRIGIASIVRHYIMAIYLENSYSQYIHNASVANWKVFGRRIYWVKILQVMKIVARISISTRRRRVEVARLRRFDNINCAHEVLLGMAYKEKVDFLVIFEDDARIDKPSSLTFAMDELVSLFAKSQEVNLIVNLSISNSAKDMSVAHLNESSSSEVAFFQSLRPYTNSASANAYNAKFIANFNSTWSHHIARVRYDFIPIDWILNYLIIKDYVSTKSMRTWHMKQPVVHQLSMVSNKNVY